ncbi:Agamous-like MADS-box protein AGL80 [Vitis vinifera]|uniref:Agamous-like MADS-box protein AGL80 n=1 Tax=Vitis vinifera TaxID=29760 RepID=A0A438F7I5_VITVI|nr:Agamous-like MADS-box protein AGL80 [Vitis vinifera]
MARKKVQLQWIMDDTARRTTYKKRVKGLMKKVKELSILCGIEACAVVYSPYDPQPEVWPSPMEAVRVIGEFKCRPENDQTKKRFNQENYIRQRVAKAKDQLVKQQKKNRRTEMENLMYQCQAGGKGLQDLNIKDSSDLMWSIDDRLKAVGQKMEYFHHPAPQPSGAAAPAAVPVAQKTPLEVALESLENQMLMDLTPRPTDSLVTVGYPGGQDMMLPGPYGHYEDPSFWGHPFFT